MSEEQRAIFDIPVLLLIVVMLAGMSGELRAADIPGATRGEIIKRVILRFGSSSLVGMASMMLAQWYFNDYMLSGAVGIIAGVLGADVTNALYVKHLARIGTGRG